MLFSFPTRESVKTDSNSSSTQNVLERDSPWRRRNCPRDLGFGNPQTPFFGERPDSAASISAFTEHGRDDRWPCPDAEPASHPHQHQQTRSSGTRSTAGREQNVFSQDVPRHRPLRSSLRRPRR